jgi:hypothetical protein
VGPGRAALPISQNQLIEAGIIRDPDEVTT